MDRNCDSDPVTDKAWASLSARRAWIEIHALGILGRRLWVALRKESVDRNHDNMLKYRDAEQSLSARRAWIEITKYLHLLRRYHRRSPQGERG